MNKEFQSKKNCTVGIISDTHGLLRQEAVEVLHDSDLIIHAGDIGSPQIVDELKMIAPVVAVRGNMDNDGWAYGLKRGEVVEIGDHTLYVLHDLSKLDMDPRAAHMSAIIYGHSHRPVVTEHDTVLYVNPGSAGPRRFKLPVSVAMLHIKGKKINAEIVRFKM